MDKKGLKEMSLPVWLTILLSLIIFLSSLGYVMHIDAKMRKRAVEDEKDYELRQWHHLQEFDKF